MGETKVNGGDPAEIARTMLGMPVAERRLTVYGAAKKHGGIITTILGFVVTIYWVGAWGGKVTTLQESQAREITELKGQVTTLAEDFKRANESRVESTREQSYIRAQNEALAKQLASIDATLKERKPR